MRREENQPLLGAGGRRVGGGGRRLDGAAGPGGVDGGRGVREAFGPLGGQNACILLCLVLLALVTLVAVPNQVPLGYVALEQNDLTGYVKLDRTYTAGLYFLPFRHSFITFPSTLITVEFSDRQADADMAGLRRHMPDAPPIDTRTGKDEGDPDSGGQPITVSLSFQVRIPTENVGKVYQAFATAYRERYVLLARNTVNTVSTRYTPYEFWTRRHRIAEDLLKTLQDTLGEQGHCQVESVQILRVDFADSYEDLITQTQLQTQKKVTNEYQQSVTRVLKDFDVRAGAVSAEVDAISARAASEAASVINEAAAEGFVIEQEAKARALRAAKEDLALDGADLLRYVKLRSVRGHGAGGAVLGVDFSDLEQQ